MTGANQSKTYAVPKAPFLYISDTTANVSVVSALCKLIPKTLHISLTDSGENYSRYLAALTSSTYRDTVLVFSHGQQSDNETTKRIAADIVRQTAIRVGCNFASINLCMKGLKPTKAWGTNHLNLEVTSNAEDASDTDPQGRAEEIYQWLFTVLTVRESLHLIPDEQMCQIDNATTFPEYKYCTISDSLKMAKDAKIQFVALIVDKPAILSGKKLSWQVADKTGIANFYFKWQGPSSQLTWDWVLSLKPGQRKCLPRMPYILLQESLLATVTKAPIRIPGSVVRQTGRVVKKIGTKLIRIGKMAQMGGRKRWVLQSNAESYLKKHKGLKVIPSEDKVTIKIFTEKGLKAWSDKDSSLSTLAGEKSDSGAKKDPC